MGLRRAAVQGVLGLSQGKVGIDEHLQKVQVRCMRCKISTAGISHAAPAAIPQRQGVRLQNVQPKLSKHGGNAYSHATRSYIPRKKRRLECLDCFYYWRSYLGEHPETADALYFRQSCKFGLGYLGSTTHARIENAEA